MQLFPTFIHCSYTNLTFEASCGKLCSEGRVIKIITYQDFLRERDSGKSLAGFVEMVIGAHKAEKDYEIAKMADEYNRQRNVTINNYVKVIFTLAGAPIEDFTASNNKIASNFFHRLNKQRCTYSLGNGVYFANDKDGKIKSALGDDFDTAVYRAGFNALIHKVSFGFWSGERLYVFPYTEFAPLWDEYDSSLGAGVRFWQIDDSKPMTAVLYEPDGYTVYQSSPKNMELMEKEAKRPYNLTVSLNNVGDEVVIGGHNYSRIPIVPFWGSELKQSTLVGMQQAIDSYDLIRSGFANDLSDCAQIYWVLSNYGGMTDEDLQRFRDKMKLHHIVEVPEGGIEPYAQDIPYQARKAYLDDLRAGIYEDFGGLDVHQVSADSTNDHLQAAYQPMDENADDFEYQCIDFIQQILDVAGLEQDMPIFKRNRISNVRETVDMVLAESEYLDAETVLNKLPNVTPDEVREILDRRNAEDYTRFGGGING